MEPFVYYATMISLRGVHDVPPDTRYRSDYDKDIASV